MQYCLAFLLSLYLTASAAENMRALCAVIFGAGTLACFILMLLFRRSHTKAVFLSGGYMCVSIFLAAAIAFCTFGATDRVRAHASKEGEKGAEEELTLTVLAETSATEESSVYWVKVHGSELPAFDSVLYCEYASALLPGDVVEGTFKLTHFEESISGYPEAAHQLSLARPVKLTSPKDDLSITGQESSPSLFFASLNSAAAARFDGALSADCAGLARCLILGDKAALSPSLERDFTLLGLSHMLAISGMHLAVLCSLRTSSSLRFAYLFVRGTS